MLFNKKKILTLSILCAISSTSFMSSTYAQEQPKEKLDNYELEEVIVEGKQDKEKSSGVHEENILPGGFVKTESSLGILGDKQVMDTPFTQMDLTEKTIETFGGPNHHYKVY